MSSVLDKAGLSRGNLARWKSGIEPKFDTLQKLSHALGIQIDALLDIKPLPQKGKLGNHWMQEAFAIVAFIQDLGYKIIRCEEDTKSVIILDTRSTKRYKLPHNSLFMVEQEITAFAKYQIHELLSNTPEFTEDFQPKNEQPTSTTEEE